MKESSGELSMTVIVLVGATLLVSVLYFLFPMIKNTISNKWSSFENSCPPGQTLQANGSCE